MAQVKNAHFLGLCCNLPSKFSKAKFAYYYRLAIATCAPNVANIVAIAFPSPLPPPVIKATFPFNASLCNIGTLRGGKYLSGSLHPHTLLSILIVTTTLPRGQKKCNWLGCKVDAQTKNRQIAFFPLPLLSVSI